MKLKKICQILKNICTINIFNIWHLFNIIDIIESKFSFTAQREDGTFISWSSNVINNINNDVDKIFIVDDLDIYI